MRFCNSEAVCRLFVVFVDTVRINSSKNFDWFDIVIVDGDLNVIVVWEESETEILKKVFFKVVVLQGTEIVESSYWLQRVTNIWPKIVRYAYDR